MPLRYKFYTRSDEAWRAMLSRMEDAKHSIYWESYILLDDTPRYKFFDVLIKKAREGLSIKIIVDGFGSLWLASETRKELEKAGGEILSFNRGWPYPRTHRKILIVDERVGFLGGVNVARIMEHWRDLQIEIASPRLLRHFLKSFARTYAKAGGKDPQMLRYDKIPKHLRVISKKAKVWLLLHWPAHGTSLLRQYYRERIRAAKKHILIATPYLMPRKWLVRDLATAVARGVKVEILIPRRTDVALANLINYISSGICERLGMKVFIGEEMVHAKALLIDEREGLVGSNNIDAQSFDYNIEGGIVFSKRDMVGDLRDILFQWRKAAKPFHKEELTWYHKLLTPLLKVTQLIF